MSLPYNTLYSSLSDPTPFHLLTLPFSYISYHYFSPFSFFLIIFITIQRSPSPYIFAKFLGYLFIISFIPQIFLSTLPQSLPFSFIPLHHYSLNFALVRCHILLSILMDDFHCSCKLSLPFLLTCSDPLLSSLTILRCFLSASSTVC